MKLWSPAFENNGLIPTKFTCDGKNISPPLVIENVPNAAESLVLIMDDPDAPTGTWVHWVAWNIPTQTKNIAENAIPAQTVVGRNTREVNKYGGPCPPDREHRYFFKLYAIDKVISIDPSSGKEELEKEIANHILEKAELVGRYDRK